MGGCDATFPNIDKLKTDMAVSVSWKIIMVGIFGLYMLAMNLGVCYMD